MIVRSFGTQLTCSLAILYSVAYAYTSVKCSTFMHKTIDPIRRPNQMSHLHTFAGSDAVTRNTKTSTDLRKGCSSCDNPCDYSSYWFPALINAHDNSVITPDHFTAYYINVDGAQSPIPPSLKMVTGNSMNTVRSKVDVAGANPSFFCLEDNDVTSQHDVDFPLKKCRQGLKEIISFPNCVRMSDLTSAFAMGSTSEKPGACPAGMVRIPQLRYSIVWKTGDLIPARDLKLASGSAYSAHADVITGWESNAARDMLRDTGSVTTQHPKPTRCKLPRKRCTPKDAEPGFGSSKYYVPSDAPVLGGPLQTRDVLELDDPYGIEDEEEMPETEVESEIEDEYNDPI